MKIIGSEGLNKPSRVRNADHTKIAAEKNPHSKLTRNLTNAFNDFLGIPKGTPLTMQTLNDVQAKFWPAQESDPAADEKLMQNLWKLSKSASKQFLSLQGAKNQPQTISLKNKPVLFSTRDGLDIVLQLVQNEDRLEVESILVNSGGSAVNVARALTNFGTPFELIGTIGNGEVGQMFSEALSKEGIDQSLLAPLDMDTRIHYSTAINSNEYWLVSQLPVVSQNTLDSLNDRVDKACKKQEEEVLVLANSEPMGANPQYIPDTISKMQDKYGMFVIYDTKKHATSQELVDSVIKVNHGMMKPNLVELSDIVGIDETTLRSDHDLIVNLAQELIRKHDTSLVLVSMDKDGAMLIDKKRAAYASAPEIVVASPGCAGDTGIGAMIDRSKQRDFSLRKLSDNQFKKTLSAFVAAGAATASKPGSLIANLEEVQNLEKDVKAKFI